MKNRPASPFILFLLVAIYTASLEANPDVQQRFENVIAHITENPVDELPVRNHPVYPERVFCRLFNISLSARAYFQFSTDPSLDASSSEDLRKVSQWYLDNPDKAPIPIPPIGPANITRRFLPNSAVEERSEQEQFPAMWRCSSWSTCLIM